MLHWRGEIGRFKMVSWPDIAIVQVVKQRIAGILTVDRRNVQGSKEMVERLIKDTQKEQAPLRWQPPVQHGRMSNATRDLVQKWAN